MLENNGSIEAELARLQARLADQAAVIAYLEQKLADRDLDQRAVPGPLKVSPGSVHISIVARGIPGLAAQILRSEPRRMGVSELQERMRFHGLSVKRASISRSLSRDDRFTAYPDGWGLTVVAGAALVNNTTNGNHLHAGPAWELMSPTYPMNLPPQREADGHE
jgi:hypothetical protein